MSRRHVGKLNPPAVEKRILAHAKRVGSLPHEGCEGSIDFQVCAGFEDLHLQPRGAGSGFRRAQGGLDVRALAGLTSTATRVAPGTSSRRISSPFATNSRLRKLTPVR